MSSTIPFTRLGNGETPTVRQAPWSEGFDAEPRLLAEVLAGEKGQEEEAAPDPADEGYNEGIRRARSTVAAIMERYHSAIEELELVRDRIMIESEQDLCDLALHIAREILECEVEGRREFTERMVEFALKTLRGADSITLRMGPTDVTALREKHPELVSDQAVVRVVEDPGNTLGGVVAECELGRLDATIEARLREAGRQMRLEAVSPAEEETES
jgi:flagellar assembly protein FliH